MLEWLRAWRVEREKRRVGRNFAAAAALRAEVRQYDVARCAELVRDLASGDHDVAWVAFQGLLEAPPEALGALVAALDDERFLHPPASGMDKAHILADFNMPMPRVLRILAKYPSLPTDAVEGLRRLTQSANRHIAAAAAKLLARSNQPLEREAPHSS